MFKDFADYLTPEEMFELNKGLNSHTLEELREFATDDSTCENCDEPVWRAVGLGLCFSCVTGETDKSDDYELALVEE